MKITSEHVHVQLQYPDIKKTVLIFRNKLFILGDKESYNEAKEWATGYLANYDCAKWPVFFDM